MLEERLVSLKTFLKSAQNQSLSSKICSRSSHKNRPFFTNHFSAKLASKIPAKFPRNRPFFPRIWPWNPAKFDFFFRDLPEALSFIFYKRVTEIAVSGLILRLKAMELCSDADFKASLGWEDCWKCVGSQTLSMYRTQRQWNAWSSWWWQGWWVQEWLRRRQRWLKASIVRSFHKQNGSFRSHHLKVTDQQWYTCMYCLCCRKICVCW